MVIRCGFGLMLRVISVLSKIVVVFELGIFNVSNGIKDFV